MGDDWVDNESLKTQQTFGTSCPVLFVCIKIYAVPMALKAV